MPQQCGGLRDLAQYAAELQWGSLPSAVQERARFILLDTLGALIAGKSETAVQQTRAALGATKGPLSLLECALLMGVSAHAADLDETHLGAGCHIACTVVPALLAAMRLQSCSGEQLLTSLVAGYEVEVTLGTMLAPGHGARGWHPTGTLGALGAAAATARLFELESEAVARALALAATQAAGIKSVFGGTAKPVNAGKAALNGLLAARLAAAGMSTGADPFQSRWGYLNATGSPNAIVAVPTRYGILDNYFKFAPCCIETHAAVIAVAQAIADVPGSRPTSLEIVLASSARLLVDQPHPSTLEEARFSVQYAVARALKGGLASPIPESFDAEALEALCPLELKGRDMGHLEAEVTATWSGCRRKFHTDLGRRGPLDPAALSAKFDLLAGPLFGESAAAERRAILRIEAAKDAAEVLAPIVHAVLDRA